MKLSTYQAIQVIVSAALTAQVLIATAWWRAIIPHNGGQPDLQRARSLRSSVIGDFGSGSGAAVPSDNHVVIDDCTYAASPAQDHDHENGDRKRKRKRRPRPPTAKEKESTGISFREKRQQESSLSATSKMISAPLGLVLTIFLLFQQISFSLVDFGLNQSHALSYLSQFLVVRERGITHDFKHLQAKS